MGALAGALIGGVSSLAGGLIQGNAAQQAAQAQTNLGYAGIGARVNMLNNMTGYMNPFFSAGANGITTLGQQLPGLEAKFQPTMAQLEQTPGYQFTLNQGEQAVANAYSGQGLGAGVQNNASIPSGPLSKGAINYAEGLASTTFQQQFQNYLAQNMQDYNLQANYAGMGLGAQTAWLGNATNTSAGIANSLAGIGAAQASGIMGNANALAQGITGVGNSIGNYALYNSLGLLGNSGGNMFGGTGGSSSGSDSSMLYPAAAAANGTSYG